jgi:hypothetical protein
MSAMSDFLENKLIDHLFRSTSFSVPTTIAAALLTTGAVDSDGADFTGGTGVEVANASAYARTVNNASVANWEGTGGEYGGASAGTGGKTQNAVAITFPQATGSWGSVSGVALCDNATYDTGNVFFYGTLDEHKTVGNGDTFSFPSGNLDVTLA